MTEIGRLSVEYKVYCKYYNLLKAIASYKRISIDNEDEIYITEKTEELGYRNAILVDFDQIVSDEFINNEKANEEFDYFICYFEIEKVTKDDVYLSLKKIVFAKDYIFNIDEGPLTKVY